MSAGIDYGMGRTNIDHATGCFGHDWFDDGKAPYRVFRVSDDTEVFPNA